MNLLHLTMLASLLAINASASQPPSTLLDLSGATWPPAKLHESVVIIIDAQREYTEGRLPLAEVQSALRQTARLLQRARNAGSPIIHIQQVSSPGRGLFESDGPYVSFAPEATPLPGEMVIKKSLPNAFTGTCLAEVLERIGRHELIISGYMTHMCVSATVRGALDHKYHTTVIAEACATRDLSSPLGGTIPAATVHQVSLAALADRFATVVANLEEIQD